MRRALGVLCVVLVLGGWTSCQPVTGGDDDMNGISTTGWAALASGEPWHYVGESGEPAFENGWVNMSGQPATAFRARAAGVVDVHFIVQDGAAQTVFTLPEGYRPSAMTPVAGMVVAYTDLSPLTAATAPTVQIDTDGTVILSAVESSLVAGGVIGFFFIDPPAVTP